jgi:hypothetical protein
MYTPFPSSAGTIEFGSKKMYRQSVRITSVSYDNYFWYGCIHIKTGGIHYALVADYSDFK